MKFIDLSHTFENGMPVYPGETPPELQQQFFLEKEGYNVYHLSTGLHVGTHIDAPFHFYSDGKYLSEIGLEKFFGKGCLVDARGKTKIDAELLEKVSVKKDDVVFVMTGFSKKFRTKEYYEAYPEVTEDFAKKCVLLGIKMVGFDTPSPDYPPFNIHKILLQEEILILENLTNLEALLPYKNFEVVAFPPKFKSDGSPVRVVAVI